MSVEFCAEPFTFTGVGATPHNTGLVAPFGTVVTAQVSATDPVKLYAGVAVMVEVFPDVAPGTKLRLLELALNGKVGVATATFTMADSETLPEVPVTVTT